MHHYHFVLPRFFSTTDWRNSHWSTCLCQKPMKTGVMLNFCSWQYISQLTWRRTLWCRNSRGKPGKEVNRGWAGARTPRQQHKLLLLLRPLLLCGLAGWLPGRSAGLVADTEVVWHYSTSYPTCLTLHHGTGTLPAFHITHTNVISPAYNTTPKKVLAHKTTRTNNDIHR